MRNNNLGKSNRIGIGLGPAHSRSQRVNRRVLGMHRERPDKMQRGWGWRRWGLAAAHEHAGSRAVIEGNRQEKQTKNDPPGMDQK